MSQEDLPSASMTTVANPTVERTVIEEEPRRLSTRGRAISWFAGLIGLLLLIAFAVWLSRSSSSSSQGGAGAGTGAGGRGGAAAGRGRRSAPQRQRSPICRCKSRRSAP
jgi:hypothetical protein